jgi:hypothetical protein
MGELAAALLGRGDGDAVEDAGDDEGLLQSTWSLAESVPVGAVVAVALIEHVWAEPLRAALRRAGGAPLDETWLAADDTATLDALLRARGRTSAP